MIYTMEAQHSQYVVVYGLSAKRPNLIMLLSDPYMRSISIMCFDVSHHQRKKKSLRKIWKRHQNVTFVNFNINLICYC